MLDNSMVKYYDAHILLSGRGISRGNDEGLWTQEVLGEIGKIGGDISNAQKNLS